jgi:hypothetical protein
MEAKYKQRVLHQISIYGAVFGSGGHGFRSVDVESVGATRM